MTCTEFDMLSNIHLQSFVFYCSSIIFSVFPHVASAVKALLSESQRQSFILHNGSEDRVLESLAEYSLPKSCIPTDLGK